MNETVQRRHSGGITTLVLDNPPVNALGADLRAALSRLLAEEAGRPETRAVVLAGAHGILSAGADIREIGTGRRNAPPRLRDLLNELERFPRPVVALIEGATLGGGFELALACHYRIAAPGARVGLPEVNLGVIPGAGGIQRLPRLVGRAEAARIIGSGRPLDATRALQLGAVDRIAEGDPLTAAVAWAQELAAARAVPRVTSALPLPGEPAGAFGEVRSGALERARGQDAPRRALELVATVGEGSLEQEQSRTAAAFAELEGGPQSRALRYLFGAERAVQKPPADGVAAAVERAAVIGGGTMGRGIAMCFASAGVPVTLVEQDEESLSRALEAIDAQYADSVRRGRLQASDHAESMARLDGATRLAAAAGAGLVVEAVYEDLQLKLQVFGELGALCSADAVLASNTSYLDLDRIAAGTPAPRRVVGMHFFSPAHVMRLLEVVRGRETSADTIATAMAVGRRLGKLPVAVGVCDGFVGNRMLTPYFREATHLLMEGALPEQVDGVMESFGMAMGPFAVSDLAGIDVGYRARKHRALVNPDAAPFPPLADRVYELGRYGRKSGAGWYRYREGVRRGDPDPVIHALIGEVSLEAGIVRRRIDEREILERCLFALINEGARILDDGVTGDARAIDVIWTNGYGFPRYRGGPMYHADELGAPAVLGRVREFHATHGERWRPAARLERLAAENGRFIPA